MPAFDVSHGRSSLIEYRPDITYKGYVKIADISRTEGFGYIHIGVGNPVGGWSLRLTESPSPRANPRDIPEGIWVMLSQFETFREGLLDLKKAYDQQVKSKQPKEKDEMVPLQLLGDSKTGQVFFATFLQYIDKEWMMIIFDIRGNEIALDKKEYMELINTLSKAKEVITKRIKAKVEFKPFFTKPA